MFHSLFHIISFLNWWISMHFNKKIPCIKKSNKGTKITILFFLFSYWRKCKLCNCSRITTYLENKIIIIIIFIMQHSIYFYHWRSQRKPTVVIESDANLGQHPCRMRMERSKKDTIYYKLQHHFLNTKANIDV